jgi:aspartyl-tRNA synthetase
MLMCHEESIHEVIAFPKNNLAASPMDECPSPVDEQQLKDLHINVYDVEKD